MPHGIALGARRQPLHHHLGVSLHPLTFRLVNAAWGSPLIDIFGQPPLTVPTTRPAPSPRGMGVIGNASRNTTPQYWRTRYNNTSNSPITIFGVISLDSTSERGIVVGIGDSANADTGINIGVGNTAPDAVGNNLVGVRGGINFDASGQAIGTGRHSIAKTTDGSSEAWYVDGVRVSTSGTGATYNVSSGTSRFLMMQHGGNTGLGPTAGIHVLFGAVWARVLSDGEMAQMHENPWIVAKG